MSLLVNCWEKVILDRFSKVWRLSVNLVSRLTGKYNNKDVALKVLKSDDVDFLNEINLLSELRLLKHPHIVQ